MAGSQSKPPNTPTPLPAEPEYSWFAPDLQEGVFLWFPGPLPEGADDDEEQDHFEAGGAKLTEDDQPQVKAIAEILGVDVEEAKEICAESIEFCGREYTSAAIADAVARDAIGDSGDDYDLVALFWERAQHHEDQQPNNHPDLVAAQAPHSRAGQERRVPDGRGRAWDHCPRAEAINRSACIPRQGVRALWPGRHAPQPVGLGAPRPPNLIP